MGILADVLKDKKSVVILGHVNPDGDCIGSCLGLYNYLRDNYQDIRTDVYLDKMPEKFGYLSGYDKVSGEYHPEKHYDLCITLDVSDVPRLGIFADYLKDSDDSFCVDHHVTNKGLAARNIIESRASSACEVLFGLLEEEKISLRTAECLYTGIIHDTGVFKHSNTSRKTMETAGRLMAMGVNFSRIIDDSFFRKDYGQSHLLGQALLRSEMVLDGRFIWSYVTQEDFKRFGVTQKSTDGVIDELRVTESVEGALFLYETATPGEYKVSLRSNDRLDVSAIAAHFGGGGHVKAAGCTVTGEIHEIVDRVVEEVRKQLDEIK